MANTRHSTYVTSAAAGAAAAAAAAAATTSTVMTESRRQLAVTLLPTSSANLVRHVSTGNT